MEANGAQFRRMSVTNHRHGFTLVEVMLAVLLMALLTSAVALHLAGGLRLARSHDAVQELRAFDATSRLFARRYGRGVRIVFDLTANNISRREGKQDDVSCQLNWPSGYWVAEVRMGGRASSDGEQASIDISSLGLSRSYGVRLCGPELDRWVFVAGLTGEPTVVQNEETIAWLLRQGTGSPAESFPATGHNLD